MFNDNHEFQCENFYGKPWDIEQINYLTRFSGIGLYRSKKHKTITYSSAYKAIRYEAGVRKRYRYQVWPIYSIWTNDIVSICGFHPMPDLKLTNVAFEVELLDDYKSEENALEIMRMVLLHGKTNCDINVVYLKETADDMCKALYAELRKEMMEFLVLESSL